MDRTVFDLVDAGKLFYSGSEPIKRRGGGGTSVVRLLVGDHIEATLRPIEVIQPAAEVEVADTGRIAPLDLTEVAATMLYVLAVPDGKTQMESGV